MERLNQHERMGSWKNKYGLQAYLDERLAEIRTKIDSITSSEKQQVAFDSQLRLLLTEFSGQPGKFKHSFRTRSGSLYYELLDGGMVRFKSLDGKFVADEKQQGQVSNDNIFVTH